MTVQSVVAGRLRCGAPTLLGLSGYEADGRRVTVVGFEWPDLFASQEDKAAKEIQHAMRLNSDYRARLGSDLYSDILKNDDDPPDLLARDAAGETIGVECTQLLVRTRVEAGEHFRRVRSELQQVPPSKFRRLRGRLVYVGFDDAAGGRLPLRQSDVVSDVVEAVLRHDPPNRQYTNLPETLDPQLITEFPGGRLTSAPLTVAPGSAFYGFLGFEVAVAYTSTVYEDDAWAELTRLVASHDKRGVRDLVISVEAPTVAGFAYPSDAVAAQVAIAVAQREVLSASYIEAVYLHTWGSRGVFRLAPGKLGVEHLAGDLPVG